MDAAIVIVYLLGMIAFGMVGKRLAKSESDFLVAGRRLGPLMYAGTMAAVVLGGASTIGGVGLGYMHGISGMWLVVAIGVGIIVLSLTFAGRIQRLGVYTVSEMLELRYGPGSRLMSGLIMVLYALLLSVTSTIAYGTIFKVLFGMDKTLAVLLGGGIVILYSVLGGMWSITWTDFVQFIIKTIGIFGILLPVIYLRAGGWDGMAAHLPASAFSLTGIGMDTIVTYFVIYTFGLLIGQDIWQRVFTARSPGVARWAGTSAGVYCLFYGAAGAVIGMGARVLVPDLGDAGKNDAFARVVEVALHPVLAGLVLAAALSAVMSTSSGALIAAATVAKKDVVDSLLRQAAPVSRTGDAASGHDHIGQHRLYILGFGLTMLGIAISLDSVVQALTIAYDILVGGLLVPILGGLFWRRANIQGAVAAMLAGAAGTLGTMAWVGDVFANSPIYVGLGASALTFVAASLATPATPKPVMAQWLARSTLAGQSGDPSVSG